MAAVAGNDAEQLGIILLAVLIPMIVACAVALYFTNLRPLRTKSPEEAVRYLRDHGRKKHRDDDLVAFARRFTTRVGKKNLNLRPPLIFSTAGLVLWIVLTIIVVATGDTQLSLLFFAVGLLMAFGCAMIWFFDYTIRIHIAVFNRYLDEAD